MLARAKTLSIHRRISSFAGNWHLSWVIQRYLKTSKAGLTPRKCANAALAMLEMRTRRTYVRSKPVVLRIEPTNFCNLRCPRCSCGINADPRKKGYMNLNDYRLILEENKRNAIIVRLDGNGEPTLHPSIFEMIRMAKSYGYAVSLSANFNTQCCADVQQFIDSGLDRLIVPIDGITQESYQKYRVGGNLAFVEDCLARLLSVRKQRQITRPFIEIQFLDWDYNHNEIPELQSKVRRWEADKLQVIRPDWATENARANPKAPKRCFWLWMVLTVDWQLNYRSCTNAWTLPWPKLNLKQVPSHKFWNHDSMIAARQYNIDRSSDLIANDKDCNCSNCSDMLVVDRPPGYVCQ